MVWYGCFDRCSGLLHNSIMGRNWELKNVCMDGYHQNHSTTIWGTAVTTSMGPSHWLLSFLLLKSLSVHHLPRAKNCPNGPNGQERSRGCRGSSESPAGLHFWRAPLKPNPHRWEDGKISSWFLAMSFWRVATCCHQDGAELRFSGSQKNPSWHLIQTSVDVC